MSARIAARRCPARPCPLWRQARQPHRPGRHGRAAPAAGAALPVPAGRTKSSAPPPAGRRHGLCRAAARQAQAARTGAKAAPTKPAKPSRAPARGRDRAPARHHHPAGREAGRSGRSREPPKPSQGRSGRWTWRPTSRRASAQRGAGPSEQPAEESEATRGNRNALANIAAANGRSQGDDRNDTGGMFTVTEQDLQQRRPEVPRLEPELQAALAAAGDGGAGQRAATSRRPIVKKMIEMIRKEKTGDFDWDSHRLQRVVTMSARPQDTAELRPSCSRKCSRVPSAARQKGHGPVAERAAFRRQR